MKPSTVRVSILAVLALALVSACWAAAPPRARLISQVGVVKTQRGGKGPWLTVVRDAHRNLYVSDHLITGDDSRASIRIDGARVDLGPRTHVVIPPASPKNAPGGMSRLKVIVGKIWTWIVGAPRVEIVTAGAVASAEGTRFALEVEEGGFTTLTVFEGMVRFHNPLGQVVVGASEQSNAAPDMAPTRPMRADPSGALQWEASLDSVRLDLEVRFLPGRSRQALAAELSQTPVPTQDATVDAWLRLGDLRHDLGELSLAEEAYRAAASLAPTNGGVGLRLGACLLAQGRGAEALSVFEPLAQSPEYAAGAYAGIAAAHLAAGTPRSLLEARLAADAARKAGPGDPLVHAVGGLVALRAGNARQADEALTEAIRLAPELYQAHAYMSALQLSQAALEQALISARTAVQIAPESPLAQQSLALAEFYGGDLSSASTAAEASLALNPDSAGAHLVAADIAAASGELETAFDEAQTALSLDPQMAPAWCTLGMLSLAGNDLKVAAKAFARAAELSPTLVSAQNGLGMTYARQGRMAQAVSMQKAAVSLDPGSAGALNNLGAVCLATGELDDAVNAFQRASELQPSWSTPRANLAIAYLDLNRFSEALSEAETALRMGERSARTYTTAARVYLEQDRTNKAWAALRKAVELDGNYALAHLQLAEVYNRLGRSRDALKEQREGLRLQPSAILETREYSRTELRLEAGSFAGNLKTDGRGDEGQNAYYLNVSHEDDDWDRARSDWKRTDVLGIAGRQDAPGRTQAFVVTATAEERELPGALVGGAPEDVDFSSEFDGFSADYLLTRPAGSRGRLTFRLGYNKTQLEDRNPDSLNPDPKPMRRLDTRYTALAAEARFDTQTSRNARLSAGVTASDEERRLTGLITSQAGGALNHTPFDNRVGTDGGTAYLEHEWTFADRTQLMLGGRMVARAGMNPVWRPKGRFVKPLGSSGTLVLLTRPVFRDDISALAPVDPWALRDWMSPLDLGTGGFSQSYELQYQLTPPDGSLLRAGVYFRDMENVVVNLSDPAWSPQEARAALASSTSRGAELEWEKWLGSNLSGGVWLRYTDSENDDAAGVDVPYQPELTGLLRLDYMDRKGYRIGANWVYIGERYADIANRTKLDSYDYVNLRVARQFNLHTDVFVAVENLLDSDRAYWLNYPCRGRDVRAGVEYRF